MEENAVKKTITLRYTLNMCTSYNCVLFCCYGVGNMEEKWC